MEGFCAQYRRNRLQMFFKIAVLKNFPIFTGKHLQLYLKRLKRRYLPVNIAKFIRLTLFIEHLWCLLLLVAVQKNSYFKNC